MILQRPDITLDEKTCYDKNCLGDIVLSKFSLRRSNVVIFKYYLFENNDYQVKFLLITAAAEIFRSALP